MTRDEAQSDLARLGQASDEAFDLFETTLACALHEDPERDPRPVRELMARAAARLSERIIDARPDEALSEVLSYEMHFDGDNSFFLDGDNHAQPLQFSTKAWNTIENIAGLLSSAQRLGPLNTPGRVFEMHVAFETQGDKRFPVVTLKEVQVVITPDNIDTASALADANIALEQGTEARVVLAKLLDAIRPGWRDDQRYIDRIKEVGPETALQGIFQRYDA